MQKKKQLVVASAAAIILVLGSTFAWITMSDRVVNKLQTGEISNNVVIDEVFNPGPLLPGTTIKKEAKVLNKGDVDVLVRVSLDEYLRIAGYKTPTTYLETTDTKDYDALLAGGATSLAPVYETYSGQNGMPKLTSAEITAAGLSGFTNDANATVFKNTDGTYVGHYTLANGKDQKMVFTGKVAKFAYYTKNANDFAYSWSNWANPTIHGTTGSTQKQPMSATAGLNLPSFLVDNTEYAYATNQYSQFNGTTPFTSYVDENIALNFAPTVTNNIATWTANTTGMWFYNKDDGYLYYNIVVAKNTGATTKFFDSISVKSTAGTDHNYLDYDLAFNLEVVQAVDGALLTSGTKPGYDGWVFLPADTIGSQIRTHLLTVAAN